MAKRKEEQQIHLETLVSRKSREAVLLETYTGIESSQLINLTSDQREKVMMGLRKQLELAASMHGERTKKAILDVINSFLSNPHMHKSELTSKINSILVFGQVINLEGTGVEYLHERLSHFWRILGWEELKDIGSCGSGVKTRTGSLDEVFTSCGNLIRTLDLLGERWEETGAGPELIFPQQQQRISQEESTGFRAAKLQTDFTSTISVVTSRNEGELSEEAKLDFKEKGQLLDKLIARYPIEFAYAIFDYYAFSQNWSERAYNFAILQEYVKDGKRKVKGIINGRSVVLHGQKVDESFDLSHIIAASSNNNSTTGSGQNSNSEIFEFEVGADDHITFVHGATASAIIRYPEIVDTFNVHYKKVKKKIASFASAIETAKNNKPIVGFSTGRVIEHIPQSITETEISAASLEIINFIRQRGLSHLNLEAAHIHADTTPTNRQKVGMRVGAQLSKDINATGVSLVNTTMIDEDHVPNALDHENYIDLMSQHGFVVQEVIYESSPVIREISIMIMMSLFKKFPYNFHQQGDALIFNIPNTDLQIELIKNIHEKPFELGCVIFDIGLTLYKIYPELGAQAYQDGQNVHAEMLKIYKSVRDINKRQEKVRQEFPYLSTDFQGISADNVLPKLPNKNAAIINVLEGFYTPQQEKLIGILKALGVPISLISVTFSHQGLRVHIADTTSL